MPASNEGLEFLDAFTEYIMYRLKSGNGPVPLAHEEKFKAFLKSLGGEETDERFWALVFNMRKMKEGGDQIIFGGR